MQLSTRLLEKDLVGWWKFDEPVATHNSQMLDSSGYGNHSTLSTGDVLNKSVAGKLGKGLSFDGNDYVDFPNISNIIPSGSTKWSISAWVKGNSWETSYNGNGIFYESSSGGNTWTKFVFRITPTTGLLYGGYRDTPTGTFIDFGNSNTAVSLNVWHYVSVVVNTDTDQATFYIDGVNRGTNSFSVVGGGIVGSDSTVRKDIGAGQVDSVISKNYFNGLIDDVRIYKRALSAGEVRMLFLDRGIISNRNRNSFIAQLIEKQYIQSQLLLENVQKEYILSSLSLENQITNNILSSLNIEQFTTAYIQSGLTLEQFTKQYILSSLSLEHVALAHLLSRLDLEEWALANITSSLNIGNYVKEFIQCSLDLVGEIMRLNITISKRKDNVSITKRQGNITITKRKDNITII